MTSKELKAFSSALALAKLSLGDKPQNDTEKILASGLYPEWSAGSHNKGDIYTVGDQVWECFQSYDNDTYPDIQPENSAWGTFNRPLHGITLKTALPWVKPTGSHDMYHTGEYMIYNGKTYLCLLDTAYSPDEYKDAWQETR